MKKPKLFLKHEASPFQNRESRLRHDFNWDSLMQNFNGIFGYIDDFFVEIKQKMNEYDKQMNEYHERFNNDAASSSIDEVKNARKPLFKEPYVTLGERLNDMDNSLDVSDLSPQNIIKPEYQAGIARIKNEIDPKDFNILMITDTHWEENYNASRPYAAYGRTKYYDSLNHLSNAQQLDNMVDAFVCSGDNTESGARSLDVIRHEAKEFYLKASFNTAPTFLLLGNHDPGGSRLLNYGYDKAALPMDDYLHQNDFKKIWDTKESNYGEIRNGDSLYFYKDFPDKKIRLIGINTNDINETPTDDGFEKWLPIWTEAMQQEQLEWLANNAFKNVPEDYHVMVFGHAHLDPSLDGTNPNNHEHHINFDIMLNILNAFKNGKSYTASSTEEDYQVDFNVDFSEQGPRTLVGYFCGHVHQQLVKEYAGIKNYIFDNSFFEDTYDGTEKQDSWACIGIDTANRKIKVYGFGRTTDQEYVY